MIRGRQLFLCLAAASIATAASGAVGGDLKIGSAGSMTFSLTSITFNADPSATPPGPPWNAEANGSSLSFAGGPLALTEGLTISTVTNSTVLPVTSYLTFAVHPLLVYSLTSIGPGSPNANCSAATTVGDSCSLFAGSFLVLTNMGFGTTISFAVAGKASDTGTAGLAAGSNYQGGFAGAVVGMTPGQVLLFFCSTGTCTASDFTSGKTLTITTSGDFIAAAPVTPTNTPTNTPTSTPTNTPTSTPTNTPTNTPLPVVPTLNETGTRIFGLLIGAAGLLLLLRRK